MLEYAELFTQQSVNDKYIVYDLKKHEAESEESFLGLGIIPNNKMSWFDFVKETVSFDSYNKQ